MKIAPRTFITVVAIVSSYIFGFSAAQNTEKKIDGKHLIENLKNHEFSGAPIDLKLGEVDLEAYFEWLKDFTGINFEVSPDINIRRFYNFRSVRWDKAVAMILHDCGLELVREGDALSVIKARPRKPLATYNFLAGAVSTLGLFSIVFLLILAHHKKKKVRLQEKRISIDNRKVEEAKKSLAYFFEVEKIFRDDSLTLSKLSERLSLMPHQLSWILNVKVGKSFSDLVNHYRIEAIKAELVLPENRSRAILDIAFNSGFNSKSTFNKAFKNLTGKTPREFRTQISPRS